MRTRLAKVLFTAAVLGVVFGIAVAAVFAADFGDVAGNTALTRTLTLQASDLGKGVTAPTDVSIGTTPAVPAVLFDAVAETANVNITLPADLDVAVDMTLVLVVALSSTETNGDTLDWTCDYVTSAENTTGDGPAKTSTQVTGSTTVTTGNGLAIGDVYTVTLTFDNADATNPVDGTTTVLNAEVHLTNVTGVADIHVLGAELNYEGSH